MSKYKADKYPWGVSDPEVTRYTERRIRELNGDAIPFGEWEEDPYIKRYFERVRGEDNDAKNPL